MRWEIHDGAQVVGPLEEDHVIRMITQGLPETVVVRPEGAPTWTGIRAHAPFAVALEQRGAPVRPVPPAVAIAGPVDRGAEPRPLPMTLIAAGVAVALGLGGWGIARALGPASTVTATALPTPEPTRTTEAPTPIELIVTKKTMADALVIASPLMIDRPNDSSVGTALFAVWSMHNLHWRDVAVRQDETSFARVQKDVDAERMKRLCVSGSIVQIDTQKTQLGPIYMGLMMNDAVNLFHFNAVHSTGDLVQQSPARFCGVVTGKYDYENSAGGTGHAIDMVGIFDLPENRKQ